MVFVDVCVFVDLHKLVNYGVRETLHSEIFMNREKVFVVIFVILA